MPKSSLRTAERSPLSALIVQAYLGTIRLEYEKQFQTQAVAKKQ
ncbi:MAG: hypothetical protein V7L01_26805 [Nostoc sp.]